MITQADIDNWFSYHAPDAEQIVKYNETRIHAKMFAEHLNNMLPDSADKTVVFRKLRELVMAANQTIACNSSTQT